MCVGRTIALCCRFLVLVLVFIAMILSILSVSSCDFMKAVYEIPTKANLGNSTSAAATTSSSTMDASLGLWRYQTTDGCQSYTNQQTGKSLMDSHTGDHAEIVAQKSGVAAPILAFVAMSLLLLELCCCRRVTPCCCGCGVGIPCLKLILGLLLTAAEICQGLTFLFLESRQFCRGEGGTALLKHRCELSKGGSYSAGAIVMFVLASVLLSCTPSLSSGSGGGGATKSKDPTNGDDFEQPNKSNDGTMA